MPTFYYTLKDNLGRNVHGEMLAETSDQVFVKLARDGYTVVDIQEKAETDFWANLTSGFGRVGLSDLIALTRQLHTLIKAGIPLFESLGIVMRQTENKRLAAVLEQIRRDCAEGEPLSAAMAKHPKVFDNLYTAMVRVGESSGNLESSLERAQRFLEDELNLRREIRQALTYPTLLLSGVLGIVILFATWVIPKFAVVFQEAEIEMPMPTRIVLGVSFILLHFWYVIIGAIALAVFGWYAFGKTTTGRHFIDRVKIRMPVLGKLILKITIAKMTRTLGVLDSSGVPLLQSLQITQGVVGNVLVADSLNLLMESVREGHGLAEPMRQSQLYPLMVVQMVATGEESGYLDKMLVEVAEYYEKEASYAIKQLLTYVEPALLVVMGMAVLVIMLSLFLPIFRMAGAIRQTTPGL